MKQIAMYDWAGNSVETWTASAHSLFAAAGVLRRARDIASAVPLNIDDPVPDDALTHPAEIMLRGYAVECLLKGLWVKRGNRLALSGILQKILGVGSHNLVQLADKLACKCTPAERDVLKRLSLFMTSAGRYPIPTDWTQTKIQRTLGGGKGPPAYWQSPSDDDACASIVARVEAELNK
ncbi:MAG: hypothetical protein WC815_12915 [Vicinamibacterales bacterium]